MANLTNINHGWQFKDGFDPAWAAAPLGGAEVTLPHTAVELPLDYFDETAYQRPFTYQRQIPWDDAYAGKEVTLVLDAAMADSEVFLNGTSVSHHADGYTPHEVRLTDHLKDGCTVTVRIDGSENPLIPPFGGQIDYLTYAGLYRDAWLRIADPVSITRVRALPRDVLTAPAVDIDAWFPGEAPARITARLEAADGTVVAETSTEAPSPARLTMEGLQDIGLWSPETPALYTLRLTLDADGSHDERQETIGFRETRFTPEGFFLNGQRVKLMGLNRHQSFPYSGYAQGRASQEEDAEILRHQLGCNIVRTSHYPQSPWFLDHCDRIGLMVLEEIPGWQHIGGPDWQDRSVENVGHMIRRDVNHPSIILWGVRINESPDDHDFYTRTNALAHDLDPSRQTGGIRKDPGSELLEDVFTFNDFILGAFEMPGANRPRTPLRDQREVTGLDRDVPYLVTEYNGHMYPTKAADQEQRQVEHVTRHLDVLNAAFGDDRIAGCIGWCAFDYNTHKDFGSGDRICHHGVMTIFREPKFAAYAYAAQGLPQTSPVLQPVTVWSRGERNIGGTVPLMVLSNCDTVRIAFPGAGTVDLTPDTERYPHLPHPPMMLTPEQASETGLGTWGADWRDAELVGLVGGQEVTRRRLLAAPVPDRMEVTARDPGPDRPTDVRVSIRALDAAGNLLPFIDTTVTATLAGPASVIGPETRSLRGGSTAVWVKLHAEGPVTVTLDSPRFPSATLTL